jgi:microcystin degradation protein MlrC
MASRGQPGKEERSMRIAMGGIGHETNTFSTLKTGMAEFFVQRGEEMLEEALVEEARSFGMEIAPTLQAGASPHGPVVQETYLALKEDLLARLESQLPVDGVFLRLHGAMEVDGLGDGESDLARDVRERVGDAVPVVVSLDLHGNIAPELVSAVNLMTALRTAPHRDGRETRQRALGHLARCVQEGLRPRGAMVKLPLVLPGEYAITEVEPARSLYGMLPAIEATRGILDASLMIGCAWTDSPYSTVSALVTAAEDAALAQREAARLAAAVWERRKEFATDVETAGVEECVARALAAPEPTVFISDSGDNVTAGGAGDLPLLLERLLAAKAERAVVAGIADPEAVAACAAAGVGNSVSVAVGGKLDRIHGRPLPVTGVVRHLDRPDAPRLAALQVEGVTVLLTTTRRAFTTFADFEAAGVRPLEQKIIVVKLGYLFPDLRDRAPRALMALSPGFTTLRLETLPYRRLPRPIYPLDPEAAWDQSQRKAV